MLSLRSRGQPATARNSLCVQEPLKDVFRDDEQMFDSTQTRVLLGGRAVNVRSTGRIVLHDRGADFST
jgi:hypothetical protein